MKYVFKFKQEIIGDAISPTLYLSHEIIASTHHEAFTAWCRLPSINNINMEDLGKLTLEIKPLI